MDNEQNDKEKIIEYIEKLSDEVCILKKENIDLRNQVITIINSLKEVIGVQSGLTARLDDAICNNAILEVLYNRINNMPYELKDPFRADQFFYPHFESHEETIRKICEERKSLARFGDGEFSIMGNKERWKFQRLDSRLAERLLEVLQSKVSELIIGIPYNYGSLEKYNDQGADGIRSYMTEAIRKQHNSLLDRNRVYADAYLTRFYVMYKDNMTDRPRKRIERLRKMWEGRHVITVEGALTRLGVGNDLFDNVASFRRILAPATSSFDRYEDCLHAALKYAESDTLFLLAIGPSSGVLAYDLTMKGYQALDIGHVDLEYEWYRAGKGERVSVPNRYNNEVFGGNQVEALAVDDPYYRQVLISFAD